jgi:hypothetical protein
VLTPHATDDCDLSCGSSCSWLAGRQWAELQAKVFPGASVGVSNDGVFRCRGPPWRRWLRGSLLGL